MGDLPILGKKKKKKDEATKRGFWKASLKVLEKEIKSQLLGPPPKEKGLLGTFWKKPQKKNIVRQREKD